MNTYELVLPEEALKLGLKPQSEQGVFARDAHGVIWWFAMTPEQAQAAIEAMWKAQDKAMRDAGVEVTELAVTYEPVVL